MINDLHWFVVDRRIGLEVKLRTTNKTAQNEMVHTDRTCYRRCMGMDTYVHERNGYGATDERVK